MGICDILDDSSTLLNDSQEYWNLLIVNYDVQSKLHIKDTNEKCSLIEHWLLVQSMWYNVFCLKYWFIDIFFWNYWMEIRAIITSASDEILIVKTFLLVVSSFNALSIVESFFRMNHVYLHVYVCLYANSLLLISNVFMM